MKLQINKQFWIEIGIAIIYLFSLEVIFRAIENYTIFSWATLRILFSSALLIVIWNFFFSFIKNTKKQRLSNLILLSIATIYSIAQAGFLNFLGIYVSLGTSTQVGAVASYIVDFLESLKLEYYFLIIPVILYFIYMKKADKKFEMGNPHKIRLQLIISFFIVASLYYSTLTLSFMQNPLQLISNIDLFHNTSNSSIAINQFGTTLFGLLDIKSLILPYKDDGFSATSITNEEENSLDDNAWKKLQENTTNETYKNINNYFMNRPITKKNEYTGLFKNKNLIIIMMESANTVLEKKEYFPNFAKLMEHGWYWENNYSPRNSCSTINNEMSGMISLFPINNICTANIYKENTYFESIFHLFRNANYKTSSYHDFDETFYFRREIHQNMGSERFYDITDIPVYYVNDGYWEWPNDADFLAKAMPYILEDKKFFSWFTTASAHHPYNNDSILAQKYYDLFADTNYTDGAKSYLSKLKVTDDAIGVLLDKLKEANVLEDTVIVLYGDHYPYALSDEDLSFLDFDVTKDFEKEKTPFIIYNPSLEAKVFEENTYFMNLLPTIANLFDLEYDARLYLGEDLFNENYSNRVIYSDGSWQDDVAIYESASSSLRYLQDKTYTKENLQKINLDVTNKLRMSNLVITENYFNYLEEGLKKYEEEGKQ